MAEPRVEPLHACREYPADGMRRRARAFLDDIGHRRIVRDFSSDARVPAIAASLTIVCLIAGVIMDAKESGAAHLGRPRVYHFATMLFPVMLQQPLIRSDAHQAAWVYRATPTSAARLLLALKDLVFGCFVLPYLAVVGVAVGILIGLTVTNLAIRRLLLTRVASLERRGGYDV